MTKKELLQCASERVLTLDGAMGTMIQKYRLDYDGNNDMLCLTHGDVITAIHESYAAAGADILSTCTFNANAISMHDYNAEARCRDINERGAELARSVAERYRVNEGRRIYVAGSMGPTNKAASMSPDMKNPAMRNVTYDDLFDAYTTQIEGLMDGGVDILLFETVFDTINLKAGLDAAAHVMQSRGTEIAIMVSLTLASGGRSFSGQTLNAFLTSIAHSPYIASVGLNCSFGPKDMLPHLKELAKLAVESPFPYPLLISAHPNAGLPDEFGNYSETPESMAATIGEMLNERLVNIVGGCCGTTPEHIQRITTLAKAAEPHAPHHIEAPTTLRVCGLDTLDIKPENNFINVGERCNVAGSRKFLRLINEKKYDEAVGIARKQVEAGALVLDINLDDGMLDTTAEMTTFLNLLASEPEIAKVPLMIDSSDPRVVRQALKCAQGKSIVNSISLKEGEKRFLEEARMIHHLRQKDRDMPPRLPSSDGESRDTSHRHNLRPQHSHHSHRHRRTRLIRRRLHPRHGMDQAESPRSESERRSKQPLFRIPRQQLLARGDARRVLIPRHQSGSRHGDTESFHLGDLQRHRAVATHTY
jgi:5-methyltetrahydrofolate--homocysteine methyltransferase